MTGELRCCKIGCDKPAEYELRDGDKLEDYTHACTEHIPDLLTDAPRHYLDRIHHEKPQ